MLSQPLKSRRGLLPLSPLPHALTYWLCGVISVLVTSPLANADGYGIDKVYDPYVQPLERELEYRISYDNEEDVQLHKLGYGQSLSDRWFAEIYLIGKRLPGEKFELEAAELEAKWQLTEQGEYANDWAVQFEAEREFDGNSWEATTTLIMLHEWRKWVATVNGSLIAEWGSTIKDELETALAAQMKYRLSRELEPGIEIYMAENVQALGPVILGNMRLGGRRSLSWECGLLAGLDDKTADLTLKMNLEYEF